MGTFTSLNVAATGMRVAQAGLAVTGHNMANAEIHGFSRQRVVQRDQPTRILGTNTAGQTLRIGTGAMTGAVHQIRSRFYDIIYRQHNARLQFYATKVAIGHHIENVLGETENLTIRLHTVMADMWNSMHELSSSLATSETRDLFIGSAASFLKKAQNIFNELFEFQSSLDAQIRNMVADINSIVGQIHNYNEEIHRIESGGENANDLRDQRNRLLDRLSGLVPMEFFENPETGRVDIMTIDGNFFLSQGQVNPLGLKFISGRYNIVEPVFTHSLDILPPNTPPGQYVPFFNWDRPIDAANRNDEGALMALLQARGAMPLTYRGVEGLWNPAHPMTRPEAGIGDPFWPVAPDPDDDGLFPDGFGDPAFAIDWQAYLDEWDEFLILPNYNGPIPPGHPLHPDFPDLADIDDPAFAGAFRRYLMERENDMNQFQRLFPLSLSDPALFNDNRDPANFDDPLIHQQIVGSYNAARRTYNQVAWSESYALIPRTKIGRAHV